MYCVWSFNSKDGVFYCNWKEGENADDQEVDDADDDDDDAPAGGRVE